MREVTLIGGPHDGRIVEQDYDPTLVSSIVCSVMVAYGKLEDHAYDPVTGVYRGPLA